MSSYTINSIDKDGNAEVKVCIGDNEYTQQLILPTNPSEAQTILEQYVKDYEDGLNQSGRTANGFAPLVDKTIEVS